MKRLILLTLLALAPACVGAVETAPAKPPAAEKTALKERAAAFHKGQRERALVHRQEMKEARAKFKVSLGGLKGAEAKAAKERFRSEQRAREEAFRSEQKARREAFLEKNPELALRWEKQKRRREEMKARCEKDPSECPKSKRKKSKGSEE